MIAIIVAAKGSILTTCVYNRVIVYAYANPYADFHWNKTEMKWVWGRRRRGRRDARGEREKGGRDTRGGRRGRRGRRDAREGGPDSIWLVFISHYESHGAI